VVAHGGTRTGSNAYFARYPGDRLTVILLMNLSGVEPGTLASGVAGCYLPDLKAGR
jgi:hypothetical protein